MQRGTGSTLGRVSGITVELAAGGELLLKDSSTTAQVFVTTGSAVFRTTHAGTVLDRESLRRCPLGRANGLAKCGILGILLEHAPIVRCQ
jgi:hypothetical protein